MTTQILKLFFISPVKYIIRSLLTPLFSSKQHTSSEYLQALNDTQI